MTQVNFIRGRTRMFGIVGDPIAQVRSPEMITWELQRRGVDALLVPLHVPAADFEPEDIKLRSPWGRLAVLCSCLASVLDDAATGTKNFLLASFVGAPQRTLSKR